VAELFLEWETGAYKQLSTLLGTNMAAGERAIALAVRAAENPQAAGVAAIPGTTLFSVEDAGVFLVVSINALTDRMTVVEVGTTGRGRLG